MKKNARVAALMLIAMAGLAGVASAQMKVTPPPAPWYVTSTADSGKSLREAIARAAPGQSIEFACTVPTTITLDSTLVVAGTKRRSARR